MACAGIMRLSWLCGEAAFSYKSTFGWQSSKRGSGDLRYSRLGSRRYIRNNKGRSLNCAMPSHRTDPASGQLPRLNF
jgi:hypothetical protein